MSYQEEITAKLNAAHMQTDEAPKEVSYVSTHDEKLLSEIAQEFVFEQYDLEENDVLRTLKIMNILATYNSVFSHKSALKVFYVLCRTDAISPKNLHQFCALKTEDFKAIIQSMAKAKLVLKNDYGELELTLDAQSLASRIGIGFY